MMRRALALWLSLRVDAVEDSNGRGNDDEWCFGSSSRWSTQELILGTPSPESKPHEKSTLCGGARMIKH